MRKSELLFAKNKRIKINYLHYAVLPTLVLMVWAMGLLLYLLPLLVASQMMPMVNSIKIEQESLN